MPSVITAVLCVALLDIAVVSCTPKAALYFDNGYDQTAIDHLLTQAEKKEMELEILNLLGLPKRPRRMNRSPLKKSAPRFLLDVYRSLMEEENDDDGRVRRSADLNFSGEEQQQIDQSDVIMTFESINDHVSSVRHERGKRLWFNTSEMPVAEDIVGAELKIYKNELKSRNKDTKYIVTVYQLINTDGGERELEYVSELNTSGGFSGWLGLNLTACLTNWVAFPDSNKGLYLSVHPVNRPGHEVRPEDIGLVTVRAQDEIQPFMVAFLKATNHVRARTTRDTKSRVRKSSPAPTLVHDHKGNDNGGTSCRIQTLYISFKDLTWHDWIIAPEGYAAYYCAGECNFPLNAHMNATNHAIVQTLVHLTSPQSYPTASCAPTKLNPISVLFFLDDQNVILRRFKRMVVKSCGCH